VLLALTPLLGVPGADSFCGFGSELRKQEKDALLGPAVGHDLPELLQYDARLPGK
jgi:hypothetical protein